MSTDATAHPDDFWPGSTPPDAQAPIDSARPFHLLLTGQAVSALGDWMGTVAVMALVLQLTGSAAAVGGVLVLRLLPSVLAGPLAARLTRRWSRRRIMLAMDGVRIPATLVLPWITELWWIYLWALVVELAGMVFLPARDASIPDLIEPERDLALRNGLVLGTSYAMIPLGAGAFALTAALAGTGDLVATARIVFAVNAATFVVSYLAIARLPEIGAGHHDAAVGADADGSSTGGFLDALRLPLVRRLGPVAAVVSLGLGALFSIGIVWVREVLGAADVEFGLLVASFGVGAAGGVLALRRIRRRDLALIRVLLAGLGIVIATMSLLPSIAFALGGAIAFGALAAMTVASSMEVLQQQLEGRDRVLAFAAFHIVIHAVLAIAAVGAGVAADIVGDVRIPGGPELASAQIVLLCSGALVALVAALTPDLRQGEARPATS